MTSRSSQKIRLVKCPKCLKILQEDEDVPVYQCGGCSAILQAKKRNIAPKSAPSVGETEGAQANESETNNVSSSSGQDTVLPSSPGRSSDHEFDKTKNAYMESTEKELDETNEIQQQECSLRVSEKNKREDNSRLESDVMNNVAEAAGSGASSGSLSVDHTVAARESNSSVNAEISPVEDKQSQNAGSGASSRSLSVDHVVAARESNSSVSAEISPAASPVEEKQSQNAGSVASSGSLSVDHMVGARESNSSVSAEVSPVEEKQRQIDSPVNKTSSAYDGSDSSSSDEREDNLLIANEEWNALQKSRSGKFEMPRYPGNYKEQGASSSFTYSEKRQQYRSLQLEGPGGRLGRQGRRHVTQQIRPDMPLYPRESYTRVSPSYPSHDEFDRYSRAHSLQMPPYTRGMNHQRLDYMFHNNIRGRGRGQGSRFSYSSQLHDSYSSYSVSPQKPIEQPEYYPRWSHEIVSDVEDLHRNHHRELQIRRLKERQRVAKRHVRPTAGGAPFISCYNCSENLQLPVDFLIFKKKHHLLRCGTCFTVLRFSLQSKTHLVPAVVTDDINADKSRNSTSDSPGDKSPSKPVTRGSPLHRLMGYSTVSQVFKASQRPPSV